MDPFAKLFPNYIRLHEQLEAEYLFTPRWHWIRRELILRQMRQVNKDYMRWFNDYMAANQPQKSK